MRMRSLLAALLVALSSTALPARAADEITWLTMRFPPFYIAQGAEKGQGIADGVTRLITPHLVGYAYKEEIAEPATIMARMKAGDRVCSAAYIRTAEREKVLAFSIPDLILPPNGITIRRDALAKFGGGAPVSLARLLENHQLKVAVVVGRSYGPVLDALLEKHKQSPHVYWRRGEDIYGSLFDMVVKGSVDYVIGYPYEAHYLSKQRNVGNAVMSLPLTEVPEYSFAHVVCPKNEWGRKVIAEVDKALLAERAKPEYRMAIERWLDEGIREEFRRQYEARFLKATR